MSVVALPIQDHIIGASHSYCFYQELSFKSSNLRQPKQIIPSIPRQHFKAPKNSSLSPIRKQKVMPKNTEEVLIKRPYPLVTTFSSPASIQTTKRRQRKVSFDEKVVVVCTVFDEDFDDEEGNTELPTIRRHSTGETNLKSILICDQKQDLVFTQKITKSLKQFKNRLLFVS
ncbi:hypothetical protein HPULCUR_007495 [Helicostylum pulchrum]|uniref:Uncharacterized protein n=1 Tax=Helicostylum pulchrum TaxID=562976 RepID=A0ABP9Y4W4_9FUNG